MGEPAAVRGGPLPDGSFVVFERGFPYQVAGHDQIFRGSGGRLCKPVVSREAWFYLEALPRAPAEYACFVPRCSGIVEISHDDWKTLHAHAISSVARPSSPSAGPDSSQPLANNQSSSTSSLPPGDDTASLSWPACLTPTPTSSSSSLSLLTSPQSSPRSTSIASPPGSPALPDDDYTNPWATKMHQKHVRRTLRSGRTMHRYLVLDDLTYGLARPCVLDVKMGKRQYRDDASEAKKRSMAAKCAESTSGLVGFRLSGYQVWDKKQQLFRLLEKYQGRTLDEDGLFAQVRDFVFDGERVRRDVVAALLTALGRLESLVERERVFRIYSTSLLLIYDGQPLDGYTPPLVHVRMIDFANLEQWAPGDPDDDGYLEGLSNLKRFFARCLAETENV